MQRNDDEKYLDPNYLMLWLNNLFEKKGLTIGVDVETNGDRLRFTYRGDDRNKIPHLLSDSYTEVPSTPYATKDPFKSIVKVNKQDVLAYLKSFIKHLIELPDAPVTNNNANAKPPH